MLGKSREGEYNMEQILLLAAETKRVVLASVAFARAVPYISSVIITKRHRHTKLLIKGTTCPVSTGITQL
jgi:hypothetical protein